jgi:PleD family two-component response regulator
MSSVSCEAFFHDSSESDRQRGSDVGESAVPPPPVVLIVENDILERVSKAATLRRQGLEVVEAADVAEAVTVLKKIAVDLLIADISLIDGTALAQLAREHQPTTQLVWTLDSRDDSVETTVLH